MNKTNFVRFYFFIFLFLASCNSALDNDITLLPKGKTNSAGTLSFSKVLIKNNYLSFDLLISKIHFRSINFYIFLEDASGKAIALDKAIDGPLVSCKKLNYQDVFLDCLKHSHLYKWIFSAGEHKNSVVLKLKQKYLQNNFLLKVISFSPFVSKINHKNILQGRRLNVTNSVVSSPNRLNVLENYLNLSALIKLNGSGNGSGSGSDEFLINYQLQAISNQTSHLLDSNYSAATENQDFTPSRGQFILNSENPLHNINLNILDDNIYEGPQSFILNLQSNQAIFENQHTKQILITIDDDEELPFLNINPFIATEQNQTQSWPVSLSWPSELNTSFSYQLHSLWANNAESGKDYLPDQGFVNFVPLSVNQFVSVNIIADNIAEGDEKFSLSVTNLQGAQLKTNVPHTAMIKEASAQSVKAPLVQFAVKKLNTSPGREIKVPVEIKGLLTAPVKVYYRSLSSKTALSAVDFEDKAGVLYFPVSTKTYQKQNIIIKILNSNQNRSKKSFSIYIEKVHNGKINKNRKSLITIL